MNLPLDTDGFLRRACPGCTGEFKWRPDQPDNQGVEEAEPGGYCCPHFGHQAPADEWNTADQNTFIEGVVYTVALQAAQRSLADAFRSLSAVTFTPGDTPGQPVALVEPSDMMIVDPP